MLNVELPGALWSGSRKNVSRHSNLRRAQVNINGSISGVHFYSPVGQPLKSPLHPHCASSSHPQGLANIAQHCPAVGGRATPGRPAGAAAGG